MLPRLRGEEAMAAADQAAFGSGSLKRESAQKLVAGWERAAAGGVKPSVRTVNPAGLADIGIGYRVETAP